MRYGIGFYCKSCIGFWNRVNCRQLLAVTAQQDVYHRHRVPAQYKNNSFTTCGGESREINALAIQSHPITTSTSSEMEGDCTKALLITANVGSIFEEPETMFPSWLKSFFQCLQTHRPGLVALHCQEVGGKNFEASMQHVNHFVKTLLACEELHKYDRARIFLDEDYTASDKFTALGNMYFIHEDVSDVLIWDFVDCKFIEVEGREVLSGNIENVPIKEKAKFPQYFFPEFKWSRKGFLRTRWSINNCIFDLVNIHLFHDASNIVAMETSPSVYSGNRQRALLHTLQRFENDKYSKVPLFIFGDFNFRLDSYLLIQELTGKLVPCHTRGKKDQVNKIEYTEKGNAKIVLTVGSKSFDYYDKHTDLFANMNKWLHQYDTEFSSFRDRLFEFDINFPPSYPFIEDISDGISYMKTRVPSWCDRVLLTHSAKDILIQDPSHPAVYDVVGKDVCMGDHKPVYLYVHMKPGKGNIEGQNIPSLESPTTTTNTKPMLSRIRSRTLSINGEQIEGLDFSARGVDLSAVNIHDNAMFEKESDLIPEFRESIKIRSSAEREIMAVDVNTLSPGKPVTRKRSFKDIANEVKTMEKVLSQWPRRPRSRHHSSSSEDFPSDECEGLSIGSLKVESLSMKNLLASETTSVDTNFSNVSSGLQSHHERDASIQGDNNNIDLAQIKLNNNKTKDEGRGDAELKSSDIQISVGGKEGYSCANGQDVNKLGTKVVGYGDASEKPEGVVLLAEHAGSVHVDSSASSSGQAPVPSNQPGGKLPSDQIAEKELKSGKKMEEAGSPTRPLSSSTSGCCSCVVL